MERIGSVDLAYPDKRVAAAGDRDGYAVFNLVGAFQQQAEAAGTFFHGFENSRIGSGHWNRAGHALAAQLIAERIATDAGRSGCSVVP